ncbi:MAG: MopE-related protein [Deltaproteobacteria bacterium]
MSLRTSPLVSSVCVLSLLVPLTRCAAGGEGGGDAARDGARDTVVNPVDVPGDDAVDAMDAGANDGTADAGDAAAAVDATDARDVPVDTVRPDACVPATEVCNGIDDDCNGTIDESGCPGHLLLSEVVLTPNAAEFIEIYNPTAHDVPLDDVYLADTDLYPLLIATTGAPTVDASDFVARFPAGATIASHTWQTVATSSPSSFPAQYAGQCPTYYLQTTSTIGACTAARVMRPVPVGAASIGLTATLTNSGEPVVLFTWDGASDLVHDVDYVYVGAPGMSGAAVLNAAVNKSMIFVDGPDGDVTLSGYQLDTPAAMQSFASLPSTGAASVRCVDAEPGETLLGGNGAYGHNETSEPLATTWTVTVPSTVADGGLSGTVNASPNAANRCP